MDRQSNPQQGVLVQKAGLCRHADTCKNVEPTSQMMTCRDCPARKVGAPTLTSEWLIFACRLLPVSRNASNKGKQSTTPPLTALTRSQYQTRSPWRCLGQFKRAVAP